MGLLGAIGRHKGYKVLLDCAKDAKSRKLPIEFVVIGYSENDAALAATSKVYITGRYGEGEASHLLARERIDVAWFPSVWPETWCYTLDYALAAKLRVMTFDLGALAERLQSRPNTKLLPLNTEASEINDHLIRLARTTERSTDTDNVVVSSTVYDAKMPTIQSSKADVNSAIKERSSPAQEDGLSASVQVLPLPVGLYLFSVKAAVPSVAAAAGRLVLPAVHIGLGPGVQSDIVEFVTGPSTHGAWLFHKGDLLVAKVMGEGASLVMTSVRAPGGDVLAIKVERLETRADASPAPPTSGSQHVLKPMAKNTNGSAQRSMRPAGANAAILPLEITAHIRTRGDMNFSGEGWAGKVAPGLWIESFSVRPLARFGSCDIEYKALTASGFETPWLSDDKMCGTKGMATPLLGFAIRLKPSPAAAAYDVEYSGHFQSGAVIGPVRNGVPCRSSVASDPLEGIQLRIVKRSATMMSSVVVQKTGTAVKVTRERPKETHRSLSFARGCAAFVSQASREQILVNLGAVRSTAFRCPPSSAVGRNCVWTPIPASSLISLRI